MDVSNNVVEASGNMYCHSPARTRSHKSIAETSAAIDLVSHTPNGKEHESDGRAQVVAIAIVQSGFPLALTCS